MSGSSPVTDAPVVLASRFEFDLSKKDWKEYQTKIRVISPNMTFGSGGMRVCFEVHEIDDEGNHTPSLAKMFKKNISDVVEIDYFNEAMAQCLSEEFAQNFNRLDVPTKISFLACTVVKIDQRALQRFSSRGDGFFSYRTQDTGAVMFVMEPMFRGTFTKYNNNFGETYEACREGGSASEVNRRSQIYLAAEAFSHFTLQETGGSMLVCDLQGVEDFLTDPQIHTEDGKGLGMGNMGEEGIEKWRERHRCNEVCKRIGLRPVDEVRAHHNGRPHLPPPPPPPPYHEALAHPVVELSTPPTTQQRGAQQDFRAPPPLQPDPPRSLGAHYYDLHNKMRNSVSSSVGVDVSRERAAAQRPLPVQPDYNARQHQQPQQQRGTGNAGLPLPQYYVAVNGEGDDNSGAGGRAGHASPHSPPPPGAGHGLGTQQSPHKPIDTMSDEEKLLYALELSKRER